MTAQEAQLLAISRFKNLQHGRVTATFEFPGEVSYTGNVTIDFTANAGWGQFSTTISGQPGQRGFLAWNRAKIYTAHVSAASGNGLATAPVPDLNSWNGRAVDAATSLDNFLLTLLQLSADRPENPQLLQQSSARELRTDQVGGVRVTVFSGPGAAGAPVGQQGESRLRFWVDGTGSMRRFQAYYGTPSDPPAQLTITDVGAGPAPALPATLVKLFQLGASK